MQFFADSARRARQAGLQVVEIHAAHGYLLHSFLSPVSNLSHDQYGANPENGARIVLEVIDAVRTRDYQTALAAQVRTESALPVAAVGRIDDPQWAQELVSSGQVDADFLGRALLRDASRANNAAVAVGASPHFIIQYEYAP